MLYILLLTTGAAVATARSSRARAHASATLPTDLHVGVHGHDASLLPDLRNEAVPAGTAARILCSTRLAKASLAASARAAAAEAAAETMSRAQRALITILASSSSSSDSVPSGIDEHTAHCASGIVPFNDTIKTHAAHADHATTVSPLFIIPATSSSSTQAAPSGVENEDTAHHQSNIAVHKTKINKTNVVHDDDATPITALFTIRPLDITAFVFTSGSQPGAS
jgi:hypothetical protein